MPRKPVFPHHTLPAGAATYGTIAYGRDPIHKADAFILDVTPDAALTVKRVLSGAIERQGGVLTVTATDTACADLDMLLYRYPMRLSRAARAALQAGVTRTRTRLETVHALLNGDTITTPGLLQPSRPPRHYQETAAALARATGALLLVDDLGLGKTFTSLLALADPANRPMLAVVPTALPRQWQRELEASFPTLTSHIITKGTPYDFTNPDGAWPDLIIINYAKLRGWAGHLAGRVASVVFDEAQELRRDGTEKHNAAIRVAEPARLRLGLSATPVFNFGGEMFNIMNVINPGMLGTDLEFAREWCGGGWGLDTKTRIKKPEAFRSYLTRQGVMLRRSRSDVGIELPPVVLATQDVDADEHALTAATSTAAEVAAFILDRANSHQARWTASGELDWMMRQATGIAKAPFVAGFVKLLLESEEKVVLFGWHRAVYDVWLDLLAEYRPVLYTGSESVAQKNSAIDAFTGGDSRVLIMSLRAGVGVDGLQKACGTAVFGELDWSPGVHKQCVGRLHRPGQDTPVVAYFCVADTGSDPVVMNTLNVKAIEVDLLVTPDLANTVDPADQDLDRDRIRRLAEAVIATTKKD